MLVPFRLVSSRLTPASLLLAASVLASQAGGCGSSGQESSTPPVEQGLAGKGGAAGQSNAGGTNQGLYGTSGHAGTSNSGGSAGQGEAGQGGLSGAGNDGAAGDATSPGGAGGNSAGQGGSEQGGAGLAGEAGAEQGGEAGAGGATGGVGGAAGTEPDFLAKYALNAQYPEGGTYDPVGSAFYVGSLGDGSVHRIDATTGAESVLFSESAPGQWWTLGMDVDIVRRRLWVCAMDDRSPDPRAGFIWIFDLESGDRIANHALSGAAADATCTDVVVTKDGSGYVVDREQPLLYKVDPISGPAVFASDPALTASFVGQNSAVVLPDESALLSLLYLPSGLARIDLKDHSVKEVSIDGTFFDLTPLAGADGMTYADGNIYVAFTSKLVKLTPTFADWSAVTAKAVDVPNGMTDIIHTPGGLYLLNGQSVRFALGTSPDPFVLVKFVGNFLSRRAGNRGQGEVKPGHFQVFFRNSASALLLLNTSIYRGASWPRTFFESRDGCSTREDNRQRGLWSPSSTKT